MTKQEQYLIEQNIFNMEDKVRELNMKISDEKMRLALGKAENETEFKEHKMKTRILIITVIFLSQLIFLAGCLEPFTAGVATGVASVEVYANQQIDAAQAKAEEAKALADQISATIEKIKDPDVLAYLESIADANTISNIEELKTTDWSDPKVASGYGLALLSIIGNVYLGLKKKES